MGGSPAETLPDTRTAHLGPAVPTSLYETWRHYTEHVHAFHPEYESWNRRASFYYVLVAAICVATLFAVIFTPVGLAPIIFGVGVGVLLVGTTVVFSVKQMVKRRFREAWKHEHPGPHSPVVNPSQRIGQEKLGEWIGR